MKFSFIRYEQDLSAVHVRAEESVRIVGHLCNARERPDREEIEERDARYHDRAEVCCTTELAYQSEVHRAERRHRVSSSTEDGAWTSHTSSDETRLVHSPLGHRTGTDLDM